MICRVDWAVLLVWFLLSSLRNLGSVGRSAAGTGWSRLASFAWLAMGGADQGPRELGHCLYLAGWPRLLHRVITLSQSPSTFKSLLVHHLLLFIGQRELHWPHPDSRGGEGGSTSWWKWKWSRSVVSNSLRPRGLCSPPGSSVHGILQARILEWVAISFSRGVFPSQGSNPGLPHCRQTL